MDHRRIHQKKSSGALVVVAIALVALTGVLFAHTYVAKHYQPGHQLRCARGLVAYLPEIVTVRKKTTAKRITARVIG